MLLLLCTYQKKIQGDDFYEFFKTFKNAEFCYILDKYDYECDKSKFNAMCTKIVKNGAKNQLYFKNINNLNIKTNYKQVSFNANENQLKNIFLSLNLRVAFKEVVEDLSVIYGYSPFYKNFKIIENYKVNFQIVISQECVFVGHPMIYVGF